MDEYWEKVFAEVKEAFVTDLAYSIQLAEAANTILARKKAMEERRSAQSNA